MYGATKRNSIKILERVHIHNKSTLNIVKILDEYYVLSATDQNVNVIKKFDEDEKRLLEQKNKDQEILGSNVLKKFKKES